MATARLVELADALVAYVQAGAFALPFDAERVYSAEFPRESIAQLKFVCVVAAETAEQASRSQFDEEVQLQAAFVKSLDLGTDPARPVLPDLAQCDELLYVLEQLKDYLRAPGVLAGRYQWRRTVNEPLFDPALLRQQRLFMSTLTLTYLTRA